jgi:hypothetical protein
LDLNFLRFSTVCIWAKTQKDSKIDSAYSGVTKGSFEINFLKHGIDSMIVFDYKLSEIYNSDTNNTFNCHIMRLNRILQDP